MKHNNKHENKLKHAKTNKKNHYKQNARRQTTNTQIKKKQTTKN